MHWGETRAIPFWLRCGLVGGAEARVEQVSVRDIWLHKLAQTRCHKERPTAQPCHGRMGVRELFHRSRSSESMFTHWGACVSAHPCMGSRT